MLPDLLTGKAEPNFDEIEGWDVSVPDLGEIAVPPSDEVVAEDLNRRLFNQYAVQYERLPWAVRCERALNHYDAKYALHQPHIPVNGKLEPRDWSTFHWFVWLLGVTDEQSARITDWNHLGGWSFTQLVSWLEVPQSYFLSHPGGLIRHRQRLAKVRMGPRSVHVDLEGLRFIEGFEGFSGTWYDDGTGTQTIGFGHTGEGGVPHAPITRLQGEALLRRDLTRYENDVKRLITHDLNSHQFNAVTSFDYNLGPGATADIAPHLNAGQLRAATNLMLQYDHANGQRWPGLTRRRQAEVRMFYS